MQIKIEMEKMQENISQRRQLLEAEKNRIGQLQDGMKGEDYFMVEQALEHCRVVSYILGQYMRVEEQNVALIHEIEWSEW